MVKGKSNNQSQCSIYNYLEEVDPDLALALQAACAVGYLVPRGAGIVFIRPTKEQVSSILDLAMGSPESKDKARKMLRGYILRMNLKSSADFKSNGDDIPNGLGQSVVVDSGATSGDKIVFKHGAEAVIDKQFVDGSARRNLCVLEMKSGTMPNDAPESKKIIRKASQGFKKKPMGDGAKKGEGRYGGSDEVVLQRTTSIEDERNFRNKLFLAIESQCKASSDVSNMYSNIVEFCVDSKLGGRNMSSSIKSKKNGYTDAILSFLDFVKDKDEETFKTVAPIISYEICDILMIVEPKRVVSNPDNYLVSTQLLKDWVIHLQSNPKVSDVDSLIKQVDSCCDSMFGDCSSLFDTINNKRTNDADDIPQLEDIKKYYNELNNSVLKCCTGKLKKFYGSFPKLVHDEMRYVAYVKTANGYKMKETMDYLKQYLCGPENMLDANLIALSGKSPSRVTNFVDSFYFYYLNFSEDAIKSFSHSYNISFDGKNIDGYLFLNKGPKDAALGN